MKIGNKILELRKENKLTQEELAEKLNVTRQTISKWELNETSPDLKQASIISEIFNISLDELVNNNIKNIIINKVTNTERLSKIIINILKITGVLLLTLLTIIIIIIACKKYYKVELNTMVSDSYGLYCTLNGEKQYYEATITRENPNKIDLYSTDEQTINEMNIDTNKYKTKESLIEEIKKYIISKGGIC